MNRKRLAVGLALVAVLAAGCGSGSGPVDLADVGAAQPPLPGGVLIGKAALPPASSASSTCDMGSLRPPAAMPAPGAMPAGSTMAKIQANGHLVVGVDQNTFLFGYRNPQTNTLGGFDIEMARAVAKAIFGDPDKIVFKAITSAQRITMLQKHQVDMVARTFTITCARLRQVSFSTVYYQAARKVLVRGDSKATGINDLGGKRVCATSGSDSLSENQDTPNPPVPVAVNDWSDCLVMLQQGQVDAISTDDTILAGMKAQDPNTQIVGGVIAPEPYGLAVPLGESDMVAFVNGVLEQLRANGQWTALYQRWVGDRLGPTPAPPPAVYSN
jgi:polar amino acid transport system substrate-binding protein